MNLFGRVLAAALLAAAAFPPGAFAMGGEMPAASTPLDPDYEKARDAIKAKQWDEAVTLLTRAAARDDKNANIYNYLGYAERHRGNMDAAFKHYERALTLNPKHRGAHEYVGEAYLLTGNLQKAEEHLAALDKLCFFPCEEYRELKAKIAEHKRAR